MPATRDELHEWDLPYLEDTICLKPPEQYWLYDAKFYPYATAGADSVFAIASIRHILVYRIRRESNNEIQLIQKIEDEDEDACNSSLVWSKDLETGAPLLCTAGGNAKIKIRDARTGTLRDTLIGHGGDINDLAISPINPEILASASADNTLRIWNLSPAHKKHPCVILLAGEGHLDTVLSMVFHESGHYILSGGQDHVVNLWMLPEATYNYYGSAEPNVVHFPHFSTSEIHSNIVDCVAFHGDLILSKAYSEHCIVLWQITGFDTALCSTKLNSAPTQCPRGTRSAFFIATDTPGGSGQYTRLLQFDVPGCLEFYMRFSLLSSPNPSGNTHPILAICNSRSKVFFWDLSRLDEYHQYHQQHSIVPANDSSPDGAQSRRPLPPAWLVPGHATASKPNTPHTSSQAATEANSASTLFSWSSPSSPPLAPSIPLLGDDSTLVELQLALAERSAASAKSKYAMGDPLAMLRAHKVVSVPKLRFDGRQVAWSACGSWCVVVGTQNVVAILRR